MKELSLHILDIAENSIGARACNIEINIIEDTETDLLQIAIKDDGRGLDPETIEKLTDPFYTTRTTRRVGLGLPLLKEAAEYCNGSLKIQSEPGKGTEVRAVFQNSHIDRMPMGDLAGTILTLLIGSPGIGWHIRFRKDGKAFVFDSQAITDLLGDIPITDLGVLKWLGEFIRDGILETQSNDKD